MEMEDKQISIKLREDARRLGLSDESYAEWDDDTSIDDLCKKFKNGLGFCIRHRWPGKHFIKKHFPQDLLRMNGILVDDTMNFPIRNKERRLVYLKDYVLIGKSQASVSYSFRPHVCTVWVFGTSTVRVDVKYGAKVTIHLLDDSSANIKTDLVSKANVIRHSANTNVQMVGIVTIEDKFHYLE